MGCDRLWVTSREPAVWTTTTPFPGHCPCRDSPSEGAPERDGVKDRYHKVLDDWLFLLMDARSARDDAL